MTGWTLGTQVPYVYVYVYVIVCMCVCMCTKMLIIFHSSRDDAWGATNLTTKDLSEEAKRRDDHFREAHLVRETVPIHLLVQAVPAGISHIVTRAN